MALVDTQIRAAVSAGEIVITPYNPAHIDVIAYELHLGNEACMLRSGGVVDLGSPNPDDFEKLPINTDEGYVLEPGRMALWLTREYIELPNHIAATIDGRSTLARYGVMPVGDSREVKPGSKGHLTLEICNRGERAVLLRPGLAVAKLLFQRLEIAAEKGYDGAYQNQQDGKARP